MIPPGARLAILKNSELAAKQFLSDSRQPARLQSRQSAGKLRSLATADRTDEQHDRKCGWTNSTQTMRHAHDLYLHRGVLFRQPVGAEDIIQAVVAAPLRLSSLRL